MSKPPLVRSRFSPASKAERGRLLLTERDEMLLVDLFLHQALERSQIQELHFGSTVRCNLRLRKLFDHGYVVRDFDPMAPYGTQGIYRVGPKAASILTQRLEIDAAQVRKLCRGTKRPEFIEHTLAIASFYLAARRAVAAAENVTIESWLPELSVRHEYDLALPDGTWQQHIFKPDGFLRLKHEGNLIACFVEIDRGNASAATFRHKALHYRRYQQSGLYREMYGTSDPFQVLVVTTGEKRCLHLSEIVREVPEVAFLLTYQAIIEDQGLLGLAWQCPRRRHLVSLIPSLEQKENRCAIA
jgi:hypothetical protein